MIGKIFKWIGIAFVALLAIGFIIESGKSPEQKAADQAAIAQKNASDAQAAAEQARQEAAAMPTVTSAAYAQAYEENTVAADQQFKGKKFKVAGTVTDINTDFKGDPYLMLRGVNEFAEPHFLFDKSAINQLAKVKKGNKVTLICTGIGDVVKTAMANDCTLL